MLTSGAAAARRSQNRKPYILQSGPQICSQEMYASSQTNLDRESCLEPEMCEWRNLRALLTTLFLAPILGSTV